MKRRDKDIIILITVSVSLLIVYACFIPRAGERTKYKNTSMHFDFHAECAHLLTIPATTEEPNKKSFLETMRHFPWDQISCAFRLQNLAAAQAYATKLTLELYSFLLRAPPIPIDQSCQPPPLNYSAAIHNCTKLDRPRNVGMLLTFLFEVDILEIHLHELDAVVDKFFLLELPAPRNNTLVQSKPLFWKQLRWDPRFRPFAHKIVYFPVDEQDLLNVASKNGSRVKKPKKESHTNKLLWTKFVKWNDNFFTSSFHDEDVIGFGGVDEIPNRNNVAFLKNCQFPNNSESLDIGIWFPIDGIDTVIQTVHPVHRDHPKSFGSPTFWTVGGAKAFAQRTGTAPGKQYGKSGHFLLGGMWLSRYAYPPHLMIKHLTCVECQWRDVDLVLAAGLLYKNGNVEAAANSLAQVPKGWKEITQSLQDFLASSSDEAQMLVKIPWFLQCNLDRYPSFKPEWDPRLNQANYHRITNSWIFVVYYIIHVMS